MTELKFPYLLRPKLDFHNPTLEHTIRLKFDLARLSQPNSYHDAYYDHTDKECKLDILHDIVVGEEEVYDICHTLIADELWNKGNGMREPEW
jgi:hypothetical protein